MTFGKGHHLHLIDGSAFIFRAYHALPPLTRKSDGLPVGAVGVAEASEVTGANTRLQLAEAEAVMARIMSGEATPAHARAALIAACTSCAASSMFRCSANCSVIRLIPGPLTEITSFSPGICASSGWKFVSGKGSSSERTSSAPPARSPSRKPAPASFPAA